jgi:hypothetical protein
MLRQDSVRKRDTEIVMANHPQRTKYPPLAPGQAVVEPLMKTVLATVQPPPAGGNRTCYYCNRVGHVRSERRVALNHSSWSRSNRPSRMDGQRTLDWHQGARPKGRWQPRNNQQWRPAQRQHEPPQHMVWRRSLQQPRFEEQRRGRQEGSRSPSPSMNPKNGQWGQQSGPRTQ